MFELYLFLYDHWDYLQCFIETATVDGDMEGGVRIARLRAILTDPIQRALLYLELGVVSVLQ